LSQGKAQGADMINAILWLLVWVVGAIIAAIVLWKFFQLIVSLLIDIAGIVFSVILVAIISLVVMAIL